MNFKTYKQSHAHKLKGSRGCISHVHCYPSCRVISWFISSLSLGWIRLCRHQDAKVPVDLHWNSVISFSLSLSLSHTHTHKHTHTHTHTHACTHARTHTHTHFFLQTYSRTRSNTHAHIHTHAHTKQQHKTECLGSEVFI